MMNALLIKNDEATITITRIHAAETFNHLKKRMGSRIYYLYHVSQYAAAVATLYFKIVDE